MIFALSLYPSVLYFEKSSWKVRQTGFLVYFELDIYCLSCVACKNQVRNRQKIKFKNQFREIEILKNQVQIDKGIVYVLILYIYQVLLHCLSIGS